MTLHIGRTTYDLIARDTRDAIAGRGLMLAASSMLHRGVAANLIVRRPRGRVEYLALEFDNGAIELRTRF